MRIRRRSGRGWVVLLLLVVAALALPRTAPADAQPGATATGPVAMPESVAWPVAGGQVSSGFGMRAGEMHGGIDIAAPLGTPILAVADGEVIEAGPATGFGLWVRLRHDRDGTVSVYGHMNTITAAAGAHVRAGQQIATVGSRGQSTGPHLHIEIWLAGDRAQRVDPARWLAEHRVAAVAPPPRR